MTGTARPVDPQELAAQAARLRSLARRLVADHASADDVVQDALAAAVVRPPREGVPLGPWLVGAVRNLAWKARRAGARRERHEAGAVPGAGAEPPSDLAERAEAFRDLAEAVRALGPPYRDVVVLHYFDGLAMPEVARRLDVPIETARTRLKRALAVLRARLDARYGRREAWVMFLGGPGSPPPAPGTATSPAAPASAAVGGALVTTKAAAAAALALLLVLGWLVLRTDDGGGAPGDAASRTTAAVRRDAGGAARVRPEAASRDSSPATADAAATVPAPAPTKWALRGRLTGLDAESATLPAAVDLYVVLPGAERVPEPRRGEAVDGRFEFDVTDAMTAAVKPEFFGVDVDHPRCLRTGGRAEPRAAAAPDASGVAVIECAFEMKRAVAVTVRAVDESGGGVAGAEVGAFAFDGKLPDESPVDFQVCDASGTARIRIASGARHVLAVAIEGRAPAHAVVVADFPETVTVPLRRGMSISGRITKDGEPLAGAQVAVHLQEYGDRTVWLGEEEEYAWRHGGFHASRASAVSGADGRYVVEGLGEAEYGVQVETAGPGVRCTGFRRTAQAPESGVDFDVATATVVVLVRSGGAPVADVTLWGLSEPHTASVATDASGRAEVRVAPGRRFQVQTHRDGFRELVRQFRSPAAGAEEVLTLDLEPLPPRGRLVVRVLDLDGRPIAGSTIALFREGDTPSRPTRASLASDCEAGRVEVSDAEPGRYRLVVRGARSFHADFSWDGDAGTWIDATQDVDVPASGEREVVVSPRRGGRLRIAARNAAGGLVGAHCAIRGPDGALVESPLVARHGTRGAHSTYVGYLDSDDVTEVASALVPGSYRVTVRLEGSRVETAADVVVVEGRTVTAEIAVEGESDRRPRAAEAGSDR